jgi:hypothetical protein
MDDVACDADQVGALQRRRRQASTRRVLLSVAAGVHPTWCAHSSDAEYAAANHDPFTRA